MARLPEDCALLPIDAGRLLVSRGHAVFCPVPARDVPGLEAVLASRASLEGLGPALLGELERHGFFGPPRPEEEDRPSVQLQLTNGCNLVCRYCCTNSGQARRREVSYEALCAVVDQSREVIGPAGQVAILGGEPFLVPWAMDLAERVVDRGHHLTVFTNGTLHVDEALARRTAALNRRGAEVRVSLAGPTAALCDSASGTARFEKVMAGIDQIARFGGEVIVDLMVLPDQVEAVAAGFHALRRRLPPGTEVALGILYLSGREEGADLFPSRAALEAALDRIAFEGGELIAAPQTAPLTHRREGCGCAMGHHLHVRSDGGLFNCFKMEEKVGELNGAGSFLETARRVRDRPHPARTLPRCADCALATLCGGGCRSDNLLFSGDADEPVCGPWRVRVISELLAEERVTAVDWPVHHLLAEARARGIDAPETITPLRRSRHLVET